ncbi:hypothetical protein CAPTEDRAFT_225999 [Capitella teleta]|uniref:Uncharacterized protein n=1 Tax=Capitella teleta TaxID=283909 RepID=R7VG80_CAPTE|nr:hypothetical protein CAPTEDRAFT_225999 [Capitella teleta]|eukprot:ELU17582.1 hypothetical protein CAPTEDRAFT_225999 [Capitella teleta]
MAATEVVDLQAIVTQWSKTMFDITKTKEQAKINRDHLQFHINWKRVKFTHSDPDYTDKQQAPEPKSQVLFRTFFTNETDQEQEYSFKTERTTSSSCEVQLERAVTIGEEVGLNLKTPCEVLEVSAGFHREVSVTKSQGQEFEQEMTWGVDSAIKVPPHTKTTAELVVSEAQLSANFKTTSTVAGRVLVSVTNMKDNNALVTIVEGNIAEIIKRECENGLKGFVVEKNVVKYATKGQSHFRFAVEQNIRLQQESL